MGGVERPSRKLNQKEQLDRRGEVHSGGCSCLLIISGKERTTEGSEYPELSKTLNTKMKQSLRRRREPLCDENFTPASRSVKAAGAFPQIRKDLESVYVWARPEKRL